MKLNSNLFRSISLLAMPVLIFANFLLANDPNWQFIENTGGKSDYPNADYITLYDSTTVDVQESGLSYVNFHHLHKILTPQGALNMRVIKIGYDPLSAYVEIRGVRIYRKNGTTEEVDLKQVQDYPAPARAIYWGAREKMIEVGRLEPGDAVEVKLFRKGFTYALLADQSDDERYIPPMRGHFYDIVEFWNEQPIKEKVYQAFLPKNKELQYEFYNGEVKSSIHFGEKKTKYTFVKTDIQPYQKEPDMVALSDEMPKLLLSTSPDWEAKSLWFYNVNEDYGSFEVTPEIQQKVDEILKDAKTELDSISILTHWVADEIRYSGISMGEGEGYTLHKGEMTFRDRCGVCKDKAGMLITMLRAAGFESYAAMTMAGSRIDYIPADQFNHSVTIVKLKDGEYHLLDPTWVPFVRELWSSAEQQQQYLMGLPEGADLMTTPLSPPEKHYYRITGSSQIEEDGTVTGSFTVEAEGQSDARIRRAFVREFKAHWMPFLEQEMLKIHPQMELTDIQFDDPYDYSEPIEMTIQYKIPNYAVVTENEIMFTPIVASNLFNNSSINRHLSMNTQLKKRKYAFRDRCSKLIELHEQIKLPEYQSVNYLPEVENSDGSGASFSGGYKLKGNKLMLNEKVVLKKRIYQPEDWESYRQAVLAQKKLAKEKIIVKR